MIKQPLAHRLRKALKNDSTTVKPSTPQSLQKNGSPSLLGGLRTPFASLFSSFRKPKRQPLKPPSPPPPQHHRPPRYDHFAPSRPASSKVEEMTKIETCQSPLATKLTSKRFDAKQAEAMEDNSSTWNDHLEKELLRVLGSLDEQLAQEQAQGLVKRRTTTDDGSRTSEAYQYPTVTRQSFQRGVQRNNRSMFLSNETRTLRAREEPKNVFQPRTLYDTYMKKYHMEDYANQDVLDRRSPVPKRWCSTRSLGHSSEGSLEHLSGLHGSGFQHKDFSGTDTVSRSYSLSSLSRRQSSGSVDQLSTKSLQHSFATEGNRRFTQRNYRHNSKRTPLSSIVWNTQHSSERPLDQDRILRTQSLMEFGPKCENAYHYSPRDNAKYEFYRSKVNYGRAVPNPSHSSRVNYPDKRTDPLSFDNWENYAWRQPERNIASPHYRYSSLRGRAQLFQKKFPSGRMEGQHWGPGSNQYYSDDSVFASETDLERIPINVNDWQSACARNVQHESSAQNNVSEHMRNMNRLEGETTEEFLTHTKDTENCPMYTATAPLPFIRARASSRSALSDSKGSAIYAAQRQKLFPRGSQTFIKPWVTHTQSKENFQMLTSEELRDTGQSSRAGSGDLKEGMLGQASVEVNTNHPTESPPKNFSAVIPQAITSLKHPSSPGPNMQAKSTSSMDTGKKHLSSAQNRNGQNNENDCALNSDLDPVSQLIGNRTRDSFFQSLHQGTHQSESLRASMRNTKHENICSSGFGRAWKVFECDELSDVSSEKLNKNSSFVRHATSNSITGSPNSSPPKSPVPPRKSASIDGSMMTQKPLSSPKRRVPFKNQAAMEDNLEKLVSKRYERTSLNQRDDFAFVNPARSSLLKDVTYEGNFPQTEDHHLLNAHHHNHPLSASKIVRKSEKSTITCCQDKIETSVRSDCEEIDAGSSLEKCKTTSMVTVSVDDDNIKYHELISVYYTLPRKHSRTLGNLFLDDSSNEGSSAPTGQSTSKKYVRAGLEAVGFPSNFKKVDFPSKIPTTPNTSQGSKISDEINEEGPPERSPVMDLLLPPHSDLMGSHRKGAAEQQMDAQAHRSNIPLSISASNLKILSGNAAALSSTPNTRDSHRESSLGCQPFHEAAVNHNPHILSSCSSDNEERKCTSGPVTDAPVNSAEEKIRQDAKVKERARHICHILALHSKKGNGLQPRVTSGIDETFTSDTMMQSHSENQTLQVETVGTVNPSLQPNIPVTCALKSPKSNQQQMLQDNPVYATCTSAEISVENSGDKQICNSGDQFPDTTLDLPDGSATENNLTLTDAQDKYEIEKRKNRPSIKNKMAAMCKTSRKFSSKKNLNPKPNISSIFSQNDGSTSEMSEPLLISSIVPQSLLQIGNENQNQNSLPAELDGTMSSKFENKEWQTQEGPPLFTNENRRPFANLCNQKRETLSSRHSDKKIENNILNLKGLCQKESLSTLNDSRVGDEGLENSNCPIVSRVTAGGSSQKKKDATTISESHLFPLSSDKKSNNFTKNYSKVNICSQQKTVPPTEDDHYQNIKHSDLLKHQNLSHAESSPSKLQRERHFSESSYTREPHKALGPKSSLISHNRRKFNSYSELLSCDENRNWESDNDPNRTFGSRHVMYPSVDFGIFGKEQQQAFLDNIKRSLTEGRLWRPCLLKNPGFLRKEEGCSLNRPELLTSGSAERNKSEDGSSERGPVCDECPVDSSESDSDTTTDDEYYPNDHDKESEL